MVIAPYIPERGDLIWFDFEPHAGHEQAGKRPALVLSPYGYNRRSGLAILCPITRQFKDYPFYIALPPLKNVEGWVLVDHVRNMDFSARKVQRVGHVPESFLKEVQDCLVTLLIG